MTKQLNALDAFLASNTELTESINIPRLKTKITIKNISTEQFNTATANTTNADGNLDKGGLFVELIAEAETSGLFTNVELLEKMGVMSPAECVSKALLAGEIYALGELILKLSGFDGDTQITTAKN